MQSMSQLEYHWNRKYQYPWIFFNDEPFTDEFKVCCSALWLIVADQLVDGYTESDNREMLLRSRSKGALVIARLDRRREVHEQLGIPRCNRCW